MKQKNVNKIQEQLYMANIVVLIALIISVPYCASDVTNLISFSSMKEIILFIAKSSIVPLVLVFGMMYGWVSRRFKDVQHLAICSLIVLLYAFYLVRFSEFQATVSVFLFVLRSFVCICYFMLCSNLMIYLKRKVKTLERTSMIFAICCFIGGVIHLAIPAFKHRNTDAMISMFLLGILPFFLFMYHLLTTTTQHKRKLRLPITDMQEHNMRLFFTILLFLSIIISSLYYFNREATDLEGIDAYCAFLLNDGKMIYRDYFYYVPPLYILRQNIVWALFDGAILPLRMIGLVERATIICLTFWLLCRWFKPLNAYFACLLAYFAYNTNVFNSYGDYTSLCQLFLIVACHFATKFSIKLKNRDWKSASWWLFGAGVIATQSIMTKHSIGVVALAFLFLALVIYCFVQKEGKRTFHWIGIVILSFVVGVAPYIIWIGLNGAFDEFVNQVFLGSLNSKGLVIEGTSRETSTFVRILTNIFDKQSAILWGISLSALFCSMFAHKNGKTKRYWHNAQSLLGLVAALYMTKQLCDEGLLRYLKDTAIFCLKNINEILPIVAISVFIGFAIIYCALRKLLNKRIPQIGLLITVLVFLSWFCSTLLSQNQNIELARCFPITKLMPLIYEYAFHYTVFFLVFELVNLFIWKKTFLPKESWFFIAIALANAVVSLMGGGTATFACNGALWTLPFASCIFMNYSENILKNKEDTNDSTIFCINYLQRLGIAFVSKGVVVGIICFVALISMTQHINSVYSFYGWFAMPIADVRAYTIDIDRYEGMLVSKRTKVTLEQVTKLVQENSDENDFVWSFPATKIYNILADRMKQPTIATTYFFDTCPDDIALYDLEILKKELPKIIIWKDVGESCWEFFETSYRNGAELGQREIQRWFENVKNTEYTLIGNVYNEYVYLRSDCLPKYTYYSDGTDFYGTMAEVEGNVQRLNLKAFEQNEISLQKVSCFVCGIIIICLILLRLNVAFWKPLTLLLLLMCYYSNLSLIYVLCLTFILVYLLFVEKKESLTGIEFMAMVIIVLLASFQWTECASTIRVLLIQPLLKILALILVMDCYKEAHTAVLSR